MIILCRTCRYPITIPVDTLPFSEAVGALPKLTAVIKCRIPGCEAEYLIEVTETAASKLTAEELKKRRNQGR